MKSREMTSDYNIWGKDGIAYGPITITALTQWVRDGRVPQDTWVLFVPADRWQRAVEIPELQDAFRTRGRTTPDQASVGAALGRSRFEVEALSEVKVLPGLNQRQIESFARYMERVEVPQFGHIVRKGDHGDAMYLVLEGELRALTIVDGRESTLTTIAPGEAFGEISLLDQGPRSADVIANQDSVLLRITAAAFERLLREAPALAMPLLLGLSRALVGRVRHLTKRYEDSIHLIRARR
jgi:CRP-like cAMP-binding protein